MGCAEERPPINRVQANALAKSFFVGRDLVAAEDDPEFYMRATVVDVGYGAAQDGLFTSTYAQPVSRIRWQITENLLNARLSYERIEGTDGKGEQWNGLERKIENDGQIVASYRIESQFDIRRDYNQATGEESNVMVENASDRVWGDREYFRVDWSQNLITSAYDFDTLAQVGLYGGIQYEPLAYYVNDPSSPDAPHFDPETGYFDITTKAFATPQLLDLSALGWGIDTYPACYLPAELSGGSAPGGNCNPTELTLRHSWRRVVDTDFEPQDLDGYRFQAYGIFNYASTRYGYERNYGLVDDRWYRFSAKYNLYKRNHSYKDPESMTGPVVCATQETTVDTTGDPLADPNRDLDLNGTADECETAGKGSYCDTFNQKCTLPYAEREATVIPWYIGGNTSEDLFEATNWAVQEWDVAMKSAIQSARLIECRKVLGADCDAKFPMWTGQQDDLDDAFALALDVNECLRNNGWDQGKCKGAVSDGVAALEAERSGSSDPGAVANAKAIGAVISMPSVIVLCHNPVVATDHTACGERGLAPRLGDIRYHSVLLIDKPQTPSSWGIMVDGDDPVTGEKVAASINIWTHVTDLAAQGLVDIVRYVNGEIPTDQITNGKYVDDWVQANKVGAGAGLPAMTRDEYDARLAGSTKLDRKSFAKMVNNAAPAFKTIAANMKDELKDVAVSSEVASPHQAEVAARMKLARGTSVEATLMNPAMLQAAGIPGNMALEGPIAQAASPFAMNNPKLRSQFKKMQQNALASRGACILHEAPEASTITGLADGLLRKFPAAEGEDAKARQVRNERMFKYVQRRYQYAVIAHEMGHSVGLRHNFVSNTAAMFFRPQYWQLRTRNKTSLKACTGAANEDPSKCIGPRYFDTVTEEEQSQLVWMYQHSTVMDYPGDVGQDLLGLGVYDVAATRFFYGDTVSVYNSANPEYLAGGKIGVGILTATDTFGGLAGIKYGTRSAQANGVDEFHYSQLDKNYEAIHGCYPVTPKQPATWNAELDGNWDQVLDGKLATVDGEVKRCRTQPVDYVTWGQLRKPTGDELNNGFFRGGPAVHDATKRVRVPYAFATDNWADTGNVSVFRHDNGADPYEQLMFLITTQENRHIFDNFRRNRTTFSVRGSADRSFGRYNEKMLGIAGGIGFFRNIYQDLATNQGISFDSLWPLLVDGLNDNVVASTVAFDHFTRQLSRPQAGPHYFRAAAFDDLTLRSDLDTDDYGSGTNFGAGIVNSNVLVNIPNGATGYFKDVGFGGRPLENAFSETNGDYNTDITTVAGGYYDKINSAILFSESEDRFISSSRRDFYDARFRASGLADVLPEGYRRIIANSLTNDRSLLAARLEAKTNNTAWKKSPVVDADQFPSRPMGWTSWWPTEGPTTCFPTDGKNVCVDYLGADFNPDDVPVTVAVDPQVGWEVQKFLIAWTLAHISANEKSTWIDMMKVYKLGSDSDPKFEQRIEWQDPKSGQMYYARTYGRECLFGQGTDGATCTASGGKWVQKGIAARVLEFANALTAGGYQLDLTYKPGNLDPNLDSGQYPAGFNKYGRAMWMAHPDGNAIVIPDAAIKDISDDGQLIVEVEPCDQNVDASCEQLSVYKNHHAYELQSYKSIPDYLQEVMVTFGLGSPNELGLY